MRSAPLKLAVLALVMAVTAFSAVAADVETYLQEVGTDRAVYLDAQQKVRIRKYKALMRDREKCQRDLKAARKPDADVAAMDPNARLVYDDRISRLEKRLAAVEKRLTEHKATMTEDDFAKIEAKKAKPASRYDAIKKAEAGS